jgi:hypothetical protein
MEERISGGVEKPPYYAITLGIFTQNRLEAASSDRPAFLMD